MANSGLISVFFSPQKNDTFKVFIFFPNKAGKLGGNVCFQPGATCKDTPRALGGQIL